MKKLAIGMVGLLAVTGMAMGAAFEFPAVTNAVAGDTVVIPLNAVGAATPVQGMNLRLEVAAPLEIVALDCLGGTVFGPSNNGQYLDVYPTGSQVPAPQYALGEVTTNAEVTVPGATKGWVIASGLLANVTVKIPAGTPDGDYFLRTAIPDFGMSSNFLDIEPASQGLGMIHVPEPVTALMLLAAVPFLRRRHA